MGSIPSITVYNRNEIYNSKINLIYVGCCPDNLFFHGVACEVMKLQLAELNISCRYEEMEVNVSDAKMWEKVRRRYWYRSAYYVPRCKKMEILDCT